VGSWGHGPGGAGGTHRARLVGKGATPVEKILLDEEECQEGKEDGEAGDRHGADDGQEQLLVYSCLLGALAAQAGRHAQRSCRKEGWRVMVHGQALPRLYGWPNSKMAALSWHPGIP